MRIPERGFKQSELLGRGPDRFRPERDGNDRMIRFETFQMGLQHPKEQIDIVGRLRNFESALVGSAIRESDP